MLFRLEVLPLRLHLAVQLQLRITLGILETKLLIDGDKVGEQQCIYPLVLILRFHGNQQQIEHLGIFLQEDGLGQGLPTHSKPVPVGFLQRLGE